VQSLHTHIHGLSHFGPHRQFPCKCVCEREREREREKKKRVEREDFYYVDR